MKGGTPHVPGSDQKKGRPAVAGRPFTFRFIDATKLFDIIYSLTRGGPGTETYTSSYYLYQQGFQFFHLGQGTAGAWMFTIMLTFISFWLVRRLLKPVED